MTKKILIRNISSLTLLMIFTIFVAAVFIPRATFVPAVIEDGVETPAFWTTEILELNDINLLANFTLIFVLAIIYITKFILMFDNKEKASAIKKQWNSGKSDDKLIILSTIITFIQALLFLILLAAIPFSMAPLREKMTFESGTDLVVLSNPAINNTIYYLVLLPVFLAIVPLTYNVGLSIYFEVMKRKNEKLNSQKGN